MSLFYMQESFFEEFVLCIYLEVRYEQLLRTGCEFQPCTYTLMFVRVPYPDFGFKRTRMLGLTGAG